MVLFLLASWAVLLETVAGVGGAGGGAGGGGGGLGLSLGGVGPRCDGHACNPRMGNLVLGRRVLTQTTCGLNATERYCSYHHHHHHAAADGPAPAAGSAPKCSAPPKCGKCDAGTPHLAHPAAAMADSSFRHPGTWWQSAGGAESETLRLDLEAEFYVTHLIVVFRSPRPAAMTLERSRDFGRTWSPLQRYASDCAAAAFRGGEEEEGEEGEEEGEGEEEEEGGMAAGGRRRRRTRTKAKREEVPCTSKYSGAYPCTRGEVIYRALPPWKALDPFGAEARETLTVTNLRVRLLRHQPCPCQAKSSAPYAAAAADDEAPPPTRHFAIYDLIVKGSCLCNGHAETCEPAPGYHPLRERTNHVVHGRCVCRHNTAGAHCERCGPLHNDRPWQPADGLTGAPHECQKCRCNGHAHSCRFDWAAWRESGQRSGGVCVCLHHTGGRQCQDCRPGFYRDPLRPHTAPDSCTPCGCHPMGSLPFPSAGDAPCDPANGNCICKPGVGGAQCDRCMVGYWGFHAYGCRPCDCAGDCDPFTGDCMLSSDLYNLEGNSSEHSRIFRTEELFSALHYSEKCECKEQTLTNHKLFCAMNYAYVLKVKVLSAHDKGSHAEVEVKVQKVLRQSTRVQLESGRVTLYPESWTARGCTCPILNPGAEYVVAGHSDRKQSRLLVNMKSLVLPWRASLGRKLLPLLRKDCNW